MKKLTLKNNKNVTQHNPRMVSAFLSSVKCMMRFLIKSKTPWLLNLIPKRPFICVRAIVKDIADVNPDITGVDIKSTKKPIK